MNSYLVLRRDTWPSRRELVKSVRRSAEVATMMAGDVAWIRTYVLAEENGSLGALCIFQATSEDRVREHAACSCMPAGEIVLVGELIVLQPDPVDLDETERTPPTEGVNDDSAR
jgi:hypothetical protein